MAGGWGWGGVYVVKLTVATAAPTRYSTHKHPRKNNSKKTLVQIPPRSTSREIVLTLFSPQFLIPLMSTPKVRKNSHVNGPEKCENGRGKEFRYDVI